MRPPERLTTERLVLRKPRVEDAEAIFEGYAQDPEVTRYLVFRPYDEVEPVRHWVRERIEAWEGDHEFNWVLTYPEEDRALGMVSVRIDRFRADMGWVLARAHWGQGLMPEAAGAVAQWALAQPEIYRVWAVCDVDNVASRRVMEKLGMECEGRLRRWVEHPNVSAEPRDAWCYSIVK